MAEILANIPDDLKELYAVCQEAIADETQYACQEKSVVPLIERIAALTAERDELKTQVERLCAPVSNEEIEPLNEKFGYFKYSDAQGDRSRDFANSLIAARAAKEAR